MKKLSVLLIGDKKVGKTHLCHLLVNSIQKEDYKATILFDYFSLRTPSTNIGLWDTSSNLNFETHLLSFIKSSRIILFVCKEDKSSLEYIDNFLENYETMIDNNKECIIVYFGNNENNKNFRIFLKDKYLNIFKIRNKEQNQDINKLYDFLINYTKKNGENIKEENKDEIEPTIDNNKSECFII